MSEAMNSPVCLGQYTFRAKNFETYDRRYYTDHWPCGTVSELLTKPSMGRSDQQCNK